MTCVFWPEGSTDGPCSSDGENDAQEEGVDDGAGGTVSEHYCKNHAPECTAS